MLRLCYILLVALFALSLDVSAKAEQVVDSVLCSEESVAMQHNEEQLICCRECNSDMLRTRSEGNHSVQSNSSANHQVRYRILQCQKTASMAMPTRRAGHVTHIFEFNTVRSTLRVGYYLYALCRLRI